MVVCGLTSLFACLPVLHLFYNSTQRSPHPHPQLVQWRGRDASWQFVRCLPLFTPPCPSGLLGFLLSITCHTCFIVGLGLLHVQCHATLIICDTSSNFIDQIIILTKGINEGILPSDVEELGLTLCPSPLSFQSIANFQHLFNIGTI